MIDFHFNVKDKNSSNESRLEFQEEQELKSIKSLIKQYFATFDESYDPNELRNEILSIPKNINIIEFLSKNSIELLYHYRIGLFLDKISNVIEQNFSEIHPNSKVTGRIHLYPLKNKLLIIPCLKN